MTKKMVSFKTVFSHVLLMLVFTAVFFPAVAGATAGSELPWEAPLKILSDSLTGPVAQLVSLIVVVVTGLMIAFGEVGGAGKKMLQIVFGIAVGLGGASVISGLFKGSAGILF